MLKYAILFLAGLALSLLLTPLVRFLAIRLGAIDHPGGRKTHLKPTARLGGFAIFISFYLILLVASPFEFFHFPRGFLQEISFWWILAASAIVLSLGAVDDFRRMPPSIKFLFQIIAGLIVALVGYRIEAVDLSFVTIHLGILSIPATVFWVVAITNAINLLDGLDGLAAGTSLIVCLAMFGVSFLNQNIGIALISILLAGSILGFLKYNFHPASIFLGDSGAYFLGFFLAVLSLEGSLKGPTTIAILIPIIALGFPIIDTILAMFRRLLKSLHIMEVDQEKNIVKFFYLDGWSMFKADREHVHHRLVEIGFTQRKAVLLLYAVSLILAGLALSSVYFKNINYALLLTVIAVASYIGISKLGYKEIQLLSNGVLLPLFDRPVVNRTILRAFVDMAMISISYYMAFLLRFEGSFGDAIKSYYLSTLPLVLMSKISVFYFTGLYKGAWRYTNVYDLIRMIKAVVFACITSTFLLWILPGFGILSRAALIIDFNILIFFVVGARGSFRVLEHLHARKNHLQGRNVLIYGVGRSGVYALREFLNNPELDLRPVGFIDDDSRNKGKVVNGYPVLGTLESLESLLKKDSISEVILAISEFPKERLERLSEICSSYQIPLRRFQTRLEELTPKN
jgi:UDP-GlcNAc:undecaprenyl-phosphate GlcNAc-1-phosphate transferase